jgi:dTDP-4-amino-4,6-dideoxygalactose transaminase
VPDLDRVTEICTRRGVALIEDAAHGLGVQWDGVPVGRFGRAAAFSFQSYKLLDAGEGGMLVTDDREVALRAMLLAGCTERNWQRHFVEEADAEWLDATVNSVPVYAFRMSNLSAAALLPQLDRIEERVRRHNEAYAHLVARLAGSPAIRVPAYLPKVRPAADTLQFEIRGLDVEGLQRFVERAQDKGVPLEIFGLGAKNARCFWNWRFFSPNECPRTRALLGRTADLRLPLGLDRRLLDYFADVILDSLEAAATGP